MTTQCVGHQPQRSLWTRVKLRWPLPRKDLLVRQLQARASLRHLPPHMQKDIGLFNDAEARQDRFSRW